MSRDEAGSIDKRAERPADRTSSLDDCKQPAAQRSKTAWRWARRLAFVLLLLWIALLALKNPILRRIAERRIHARTGLAVRISDFNLGLASATLSLKGIKLYNPPEFGGTVLLDIPELFLKLDAGEAASGRLRFKQFRLHLAEVNLVKNREGQFNFDALREKTADPLPATQRSNPSEPRLAFGGIDRLELTLGKVNYSDVNEPGNNQVFALGVTNEVATDLRTREDLTQWCARFAFRRLIEELFNRPGQSKEGRFKVILDEPIP